MSLADKLKNAGKSTGRFFLDYLTGIPSYKDLRKCGGFMREWYPLTDEYNGPFLESALANLKAAESMTKYGQPIFTGVMGLIFLDYVMLDMNPVATSIFEGLIALMKGFIVFNSRGVVSINNKLESLFKEVEKQTTRRG
jgi:hypothetical protein